MARTHLRKTVLTGTAAVLAATALLTACGQLEPGPQGGSESSASSGGAPEEGEAAKAGPEQQAGSEAEAEQQTETKAEGKEVTGTWFGNVSYLAPGKYTVSDQGPDQAFWTSEDTDIQGTGDICGDENGQAATPCSEAELEAAAKKGVSAKVELKNGVAVSIIDDK